MSFENKINFFHLPKTIHLLAKNMKYAQINHIDF